MSFNKNAHPQPQHYHKGKPKQAHQIIVPEQSTDQYKNTHESDDDDDDFVIAFQLCTQPQKKMFITKRSLQATHRNTCMPTFHIVYNPIIDTTSIYMYSLTHADVNLMPESVYKLVFNYPYTSKLAKNDIDLTVYT